MSQEKKTFNNVKVFGADKNTSSKVIKFIFFMGHRDLPNRISIETALIAKSVHLGWLSKWEPWNSEMVYGHIIDTEKYHFSFLFKSHLKVYYNKMFHMLFNIIENYLQVDYV